MNQEKKKTNMSGGTTKKKQTKSQSGLKKTKKSKQEESNSMIPEDLYNEISKFVDKKTLLEYLESVQKSNEDIVQEMKKAYTEKFRPFEENFLYREFPYAQPLEEAFFSAKPIILCIGQYSSGKSTFVKYLIDKDYPGIRIGPEPTTDKFVAVMYGEENAIIPGNALVLDDRRPFKPLAKFGGKFLNRFQAAQVNSPVLKGLTIIDTPGVLSDNSDNCDGYPYKAVIEWFAQQADRIFLFVDAHKLELSGEFQQIIDMIRIYDDKLRIVLSKTDLVNDQEMIRVYGALMWFLGQSLEMNEVIQIFCGSFWGKPFPGGTRRRLYEHEEFRIYEDLSNLPQESLLRKVNFLAQRARRVTMHACLVANFKESMRRLSLLRFIFERQVKRLYVRKLNKIRTKVETEHNFDRQEGPDISQMKVTLLRVNLHKTKTFNKKMFALKDKFVDEDLPAIVDKINQGKFAKIFEQIGKDEGTPFGFEKGEGFDEGSLDPGEWIVTKYKHLYVPLFDELKQGPNKVTAATAKAQMLKSNLPAKVLNKIWIMSDIDHDGQLDRDEFFLAMYLISVTLKNYDLPEELPRHLIPPSKRTLKNY